jgi:NAD(P)-dependent dehydrogenase (short-subunit alcohol dehydrogenase family)
MVRFSVGSDGRFNLPGKTAFVTGGARGIGFALARTLHAGGAKVVLSDIDGPAVIQAAATVGQVRTMGVAVDVTDRVSLNAAVEAALERFGGLDIVVANAGIAPVPAATVLTTDQAVFDRTLDVNLFGVWNTVQATLPQLIARRGHIVLTASIYAFLNGAATAPYAITKAGVESLGRALRTELAASGVTAGVLYPGWVDTQLVHAAIDADPIASRMLDELFPGPLARRVTADEVANAAVRGIERRAARTVVPKRWLPLLFMRGIANPLLDHLLDGNSKVQKALHDLEMRGRPAASSRVGWETSPERRTTG